MFVSFQANSGVNKSYNLLPCAVFMIPYRHVCGITVHPFSQDLSARDMISLDHISKIE